MTQPDGTEQASRDSVTAPPGRVRAAVLACVQGGVTSVTTVLVFAGAGHEGGSAGFRVPVGGVQAVGVVLLVLGAVRLLRGQGRPMLVVGCAVELVLCAYYLVRFASESVGGNGVLIGIALSFAVLPAIVLMSGSPQPSAGPRLGGGRVVAAVLAFVQAGVTLVVAVILLAGLVLSDDVTDTPLLSTSAGDVRTGAGLGELWSVSLLQLVGVALLIAGGVRLVSGRADALFPVATGLQLALCGYWWLRSADSLTPAVLAVMPVAALALGLRAANKEPA